MDDLARQAAATIIEQKRDALVSERVMLLERRSELLIRLRQIDRDLEDCKAASRLFGLELEIPADHRDEVYRELTRETIMRERDMSERASMRSSSLASRLASELSRTLPVKLPSVPPVPAIISPPPAPATPPPSPPTQSPPVGKRPTIREIVLGYVTRTGNDGTKAAPIREFVEIMVGETVHEKTVGMTLYRLLKEKLVRREGHVWFPVPPVAETGNPGGETPGPDNLHSNERCADDA